MSSTVVVDASFALQLVLSEPHSAAVQDLWVSWSATEAEIYAPCHLLFEAISVIRNRVYRNLLTPDEGEAAYRLFIGLEIELVHPESLDTAWMLAREYNRPTAYDAYYLALAEMLDCELWTADVRFVRATVSNPRIRSIGTTTK